MQLVGCHGNSVFIAVLIVNKAFAEFFFFSINQSAAIQKNIFSLRSGNASQPNGSIAPVIHILQLIV